MTHARTAQDDESPVEIGHGLAIKDVAEATGLAAGTIRMWEQRYDFPVPRRTASGYRRYSTADVETLKTVVALRQRGLSVPAAIARARDTGGPSDRPSIYAAVAGSDPSARPQTLRKSTLIALSRAIEHEALARAAGPILVGAFQRTPFYRDVEPRYSRIAGQADAAFVFADFDEVRHEQGRPSEIPIDPQDALGNEWAVIVDSPGYAACLLAWEIPGDTQPGGPHDLGRRYESLWTVDPEVTRRATHVAARLAGRADPAYGARLEELLHDRPMAVEQPAPALTSLTNRVVAYLEEA
ncbi:MerR family transcriptional regulator [Conexibacter sp. W3-3-2]|uniref:HTH merR-type domain-containing protein n=1 Tax=Paraconexibacter algicola TaxID=2133960 RepID=A0A2T4UMI8_9ACTN|nr:MULTISPECIES: DICT sensory domain-containing protein [Solirubrobacterales]MTD46775.1 MerR family transcriptional regulator [Conexibacter sp. W3-3-2]PTL60466.1 hypothetical protein C7Y72_12860 [Paraconexibacter algicola]